MGATFKIYDTYIAPATDALQDLGSSALEWKDLYIDGIAYIDEIRLSTNEKIWFRDAAIHIRSDADGHLDITADVSIDLNGNVVLGAKTITVNSVEIVGSDGEVNKAAVEDSTNWDAAHTQLNALIFYENNLVSYENDFVYCS